MSNAYMQHQKVENRHPTRGQIAEIEQATNEAPTCFVGRAKLIAKYHTCMLHAFQKKKHVPSNDETDCHACNEIPGTIMKMPEPKCMRKQTCRGQKSKAKSAAFLGLSYAHCRASIQTYLFLFTPNVDHRRPIRAPYMHTTQKNAAVVQAPKKCIALLYLCYFII